MGRFKDRTGERIGRLTVIERDSDFISNGGARRTMWKCRCDCGNIVSVRADSLNGDHTTSCGCLQKEKASETASNRKREMAKEGMSKERLHNIWYLMLYRCNNPKSAAYRNYGARGITVCSEWNNGLEGYKSFRAWALENGYNKEKTLDRIDNNMGYSPENCRWATLVEQSNNKRTNRWIKVNEEQHTTFQWDRIKGFKSGLVNSRINRGWSEEDAVNTPSGQRRPKR